MRSKGEGSVFKQTRKRKDGTTYERWCCEVTIDGVTKRKYGATKKEVATWKNEFLATHKKIPVHTITTLGEAYNSFFQHKKETIKKSTMDSYKGTIKNFIRFFGKETKVAKITNHEAKVFFKSLEKYKVSSQKKFVVQISNFFSFLIKKNIIDKNPITDIKIKKEISKKIKIIPKEELRKLLSMLKIKSEKAKVGSYAFYIYYICILLANTGLRIGEALALTWEDINFETHTINVNKTIGKDLTVGTPKTPYSERELYVNHQVLNIIKELKPISPMYIFSKKPKPPFTQIFSVYLKEWTQGKYHFHMFRHTYATTLLSMNVDINSVSKRLGHGSPVTTLQVYAHYIKDKDEEIGKMQVI